MYIRQGTKYIDYMTDMSYRWNTFIYTVCLTEKPSDKVRRFGANKSGLKYVGFLLRVSIIY